MDILYLCDRRACEKCHPECKHTMNINHAKNFEKGPKEGSYIETGKPLLVLKTNAMVKKDVLDRIREDLTAQIASGVIFCDGFVTPVMVDSDNCIYNVTITKEKPNESH